LERLIVVLYPPGCELIDALPLKLAELYEMIMSHSAFVPTMLSKTSADVKGKDDDDDNNQY